MRTNEEGFVLPFTAILLMVLFLVGGIITDTGAFYLRHGELHHLSKQSAHAGMLTFVEILEEVAEENKTFWCDNPEPPPLCHSNNMFDFLTVEEVVELVSSPQVQLSVTQSSQLFAITYDPETLIEVQNVAVIFPYQYDSPAEIQIQVSIFQEPSPFLKKIATPRKTIEVQSVGYINTPF